MTHFPSYFTSDRAKGLHSADSSLGLLLLVCACTGVTASTEGETSTETTSSTGIGATTSGSSTTPTTSTSGETLTSGSTEPDSSSGSSEPVTSSGTTGESTTGASTSSTSGSTSGSTTDSTTDSTSDSTAGSTTGSTTDSTSGSTGGSTGVEPICTPKAAECLSLLDYHVCANDGLSWSAPTKCPSGAVCEDGACNSACQKAAADPSSDGCIFYAIDANNDPLDDNDADPYGVIVANTVPGVQNKVDVEIYGNNGWTTFTSSGVFTTFQFDLPDRHINYTGFNDRGAYRIRSTYPITVFQFQPLSGNPLWSSDASLLLPAHTFDTSFYLVGWGVNTIANAQINIVAAADDTHVTITPTVPTAPGNPIPALQALNPQALPVMNDGDVIQIEMSKGQVSGTYIASDKPIAVYSTHWCANVPSDAFKFCDHLEEQIVGLKRWGKVHVAGRLPVRSAGVPEQTFWQIFAAEDATTIHIDHDPAVTGIPADDFLMTKGQQLFLSVGGTVSRPGDFVVTADKPIFMMQYMGSGQITGQPPATSGDPAMVQSIPVEQFRTRHVVASASPWTFDRVVLTKKSGSTVKIDGVTVAQGNFTAIGATEWEVARVSLPDGGHELTGDLPFGAVLAGWGELSSYAYPGGTALKVLNP